jgi:hypothetical protein
MKKHPYFVLACLLLLGPAVVHAQTTLTEHPNTSNWPDLFNASLTNAMHPDGVWSVTDGVLTATEDQGIWSTKDYDNFILDLEFKTAEGTNSGVIIYVSDIENWIPNSLEIQIADDYAEQWANGPSHWQCGAVFGRQAAYQRVVKQPGEWNRFTIQAIDQKISVLLNGELINVFDMSRFTSASINPNGSEAPSWLSKAPATLATHGRIGFQGKHAGAPIWFRDIKVKELN